MEAVLTLRVAREQPRHDLERIPLPLRPLFRVWKGPSGPKKHQEPLNSDLDRARMLLFTLSHFWNGSGKLKLTVITPPTDVQLIRECLSSTATVDVRVVNETEVIPFLSACTGSSGWYKQQALKLAYASLAAEEFFLTLDADLLCTHDLSEASLVVDNKALTDWEPRAMHPQWWASSARLLKLPLHVDGMGLSVTPAVLSRTVCRKLLDYITEISARDCYRYLLGNFGWTEYTLYNIFADFRGLTGEYHHTQRWMLHNRKSVRADVNNSKAYNFWSEQQFRTWRPEDAFAPDAQGLFMVCQSNSKIPPSAVWNRVRDRFPGEF